MKTYTKEDIIKGLILAKAASRPAIHGETANEQAGCLAFCYLLGYFDVQRDILDVPGAWTKER